MGQLLSGTSSIQLDLGQQKVSIYSIMENNPEKNSIYVRPIVWFRSEHQWQNNSVHNKSAVNRKH